MEICETALNIILKAIQDNGYTEKYVADNCGLSNGFFSDWKRGRRNSPSFDKVFKILRFLNVSIDSLNTENGSFSYIEQQSQTDKALQQSDLSEDQLRVLAKYRSLDLDGKDSVKGFIIAEQRRANAARGTAQQNHLAI